ncbi:MAG TPA: DoxX family protein [Candidatus Baltobacteraceae bacterium]|nr:DoxX family protein [Candidatus Baltobacteraceae bacterium]
MNLAYLAVTGVTIVVNAGAVAADFANAGFVLKTAREVHVSRSWLPLLGALKAAGVVGLLLGMLGIRIIGIAGAAGLVIFFTGAVIAHVRARVFYNIAFPGFYLALAVASLALACCRFFTAS